MTDHEPMEALLVNAAGAAPVLLTCEHATNYIPPRLQRLGLPAELLSEHVAWDPGALELATVLAERMNAPLIAAPASRLLIDPNRDFDAPDLIPARAERRPIPQNLALSASERAARVSAYHAPYHRAIERLLGERRDIGALVSIHSFTSELMGRARPWHVGIIHGEDRRLADPLFDYLNAIPRLVVGRNEPYSASDGVFFSMRRHAQGRAAVMLEVRNDQLADEMGVSSWSHILAEAIEAALSSSGLDCAMDRRSANPARKKGNA